GMYEPVLEALSQAHIADLSAFVLGCAVGALVFIQLLEWLLAHYYSLVMAVAAGVMLGSLAKLWRWSIGWEEAREQIVYPAEYVGQVAVPAHIGCGVMALLVGGVVVYSLCAGYYTAEHMTS